MSLRLTKDNIVVGEDVELTEGITLGDVQLATLRLHENKILQIDAETGEKQSADVILNRSIALAQWLVKNGVKPGDAISINSENRLEFIMVPVATIFAGGVFAPLNPEYTEIELEHVINLSKPAIIFCTKWTLERTKILAARHSYIKKLVLFGKTRINDPSLVMYEDIIKDASSDNEEYEPVSVDPKEAVVTILCSSGTTGLPKGVMTTHANMTAFIDISRVMLSDLLDENHPEVVTLGLTPFFHSMGFMSVYMHMLAGNKVIVIRKFKTKLFFETIQKFKGGIGKQMGGTAAVLKAFLTLVDCNYGQVTNLVIPPPLVLLLTKHPLAGKYRLSTLKDVRSGAAPLGKKTELEMKEKHKLQHISQGYGLTETTFGILMTKTSSPRLGSVGQLVPGVQAKVIDENGKALGPRQEGEVCFKGPLIMKGYVGDPEATRNTIDENGWLHTGDVVYFDEDGYFFIVDRIKELIKYKAFQVAPAELEALLHTHPAVADVAVVGLPDEDAGELPLAYVVKRPGMKVTEKELQDFVAGKVSRQKQLRGGVRFLNEIPRNPSGKILRRILKQKAKETKSKL